MAIFVKLIYINIFLYILFKLKLYNNNEYNNVMMFKYLHILIYNYIL